MSRRLMVLTGYFLRNIFFSLAGSIYVILALAYWAIFFPPGQGTPDVDNYILIIGAFGAAMTFLATLTIASRAYRAEYCPLIVRLPSRPCSVSGVRPEANQAAASANFTAPVCKGQCDIAEILGRRRFTIAN